MLKLRATVEHDVHVEEKVCPQCGEEMHLIGKEVWS